MRLRLPKALASQRLGAEPVPGPKLHPPRRKQLLKFVVTAALQQARQADGCSNYMLEGLVVGPGAPHHFDQSVGIFVDQVRVSGDLAPAIFERRQIFDAVVLHRLEQSLEPLASGRWSAGAAIRIGISSLRVRKTAAPRAPDEVSMPWNAGQMRSINDTTPSPAATGSDFATDLISAAASLSRPIANLTRASHRRWRETSS